MDLQAYQDASKHGFRLGGESNKGVVYNYHPESKDELKEVLKNLVVERGLEGEFNDIDVSHIIELSEVFPKNFNGDISLWDTSLVHDMSNAFALQKAFNSDISTWDVSNVTNMSGMFTWCKSFNCDISGWDTSNVTNMNSMFYSARRFDKDISN